MSTDKPRRLLTRPLALSAGVALLLAAYALLLSSARQHSATVDEQSHLLRGVAYLQAGATHFLLGHPLLASSLSALPLLTERELALPVESAAWAAGDWSVAGDLFLWQMSEQPLRLLFLGRLPVIWLALFLGALVYRWAREWVGRGAGLVAMGLLLLDPNLIAHGRLITGDLPVALFFVVALYGFWRYARAAETGSAAWPALLVAGLGAGLAVASKFNGAVALPVLGIQAAVLSWRQRRLRPLLALAPVLLLAWVVVAAVYRFQLWQGVLPGGAFWDDLLWQGEYVQQSHGVFLFGRVAKDGWWYYFPATFLLKTPLPNLFLLAGAVAIHLVRRRAAASRSLAPGLFLLLPPASYLLASSAAALNIGYRYQLPGLPLLALFSAVMLLGGGTLPWRRQRRAVAALGVFILALRTISVWPDYISYFNLAAGGGGWRLLADSNVDWGQDLPALARWQASHPAAQPLYLSYFGTAHPSAYGVRFRSLPSWDPAPEKDVLASQLFDPEDPAPGVYAISVNNLHGVVLGEQRDLYRAFRHRQPDERLGGSIFLYEVPAHGPPVDVALSGLRPATLSPELKAALSSNDLRVRWFDHTRSFVWPAGGGWMAAPAEPEPPPALAAFWPVQPAVTSGGQALVRLGAGSAPSWLLPAAAGERALLFRGARLLPAAAGEVNLLTAWEAEAPSSRPLKLFVHALDERGAIAGQWDGLDVAPSFLWPGDIFVQFHQFSLPDGAPPVRFVAGVYDGATMMRLTELTLEGN